DARHVLVPGRSPAAHAYLAGADSRDGRAPATIAPDRSGQGLSQRLRPDPFTDVPPGRRLADRRGRELRRSQGYARELRARVLRTRFRDAPAAEFLSVHRALRRSRHRL